MELETEAGSAKTPATRRELEIPNQPIAGGLLDKSTRRNSLLGYLMVACAAAMWGIIGILFSVLHFQYHLSSLAIAFLRALFSAAILIAILAVTKPALLRLTPSLFKFYVLFGLFGVAFFYIFNVEAVFLTNVATASVLLYTAPALVSIFAWRLWREPITTRKIFAVVLAFVGCALVARAYDPAELRLNLMGVLVGIAAGLGFSFFIIFMKASALRAPLWTNVAYSLLFAAVFLIPVQFAPIAELNGEGIASFLREPGAWIVMLGVCLGPTLGSYTLYNAAARYVPASNASLVATIEPVVASVAGFVVFSQVLEPLQIVGAGLIIAAAVSLSLK